MHFITLVVLGIGAAATVWLAVYVFLYLPYVMQKQLRESMKAFSTAVELRFPSHRGLSERVLKLSREVGEELGLSRRRLTNLEMAATLRDVGMCAVPYALVNERDPRAWTPAEAHAYERHGEVSGAMLELVPRLKHLAPIVGNHHVDFSSSEPISGVLRSQIPLEAFILNAVTAYLWTERLEGYAAAREDLTRRAGTTYDPHVVEVLLRVLPSHRVGVTDPAELVRS